MERESFVCYASFIKAGNNLSDNDRLKYYDRVLNYAVFGIDNSTEGIAETLFILVKPNIDANNIKYMNGKKGGKHGVKGGRPPKVKTPVGFQEKTPNEDEDVNEDVNEDKKCIKINYRENVKLTEKEYTKILEKYSKQGMEFILDKLSAYKLSNNKKYTSDYGAINSRVGIEREKYKKYNKIICTREDMKEEMKRTWSMVEGDPKRYGQGMREIYKSLGDGREDKRLSDKNEIKALFLK